MIETYFIIAATFAVTLLLVRLGFLAGRALRRRREDWRAQIEDVRDMVWSLEKRIFKAAPGDAICFKIYSRYSEAGKAVTLEERVRCLEQEIVNHLCRVATLEELARQPKDTKKPRRSK